MLEEDAVALAQLVTSASGSGDSAYGDSLLASWRSTVATEMARTIPVTVRYEIAELRGDSLLLFPDIYRRHTGATVARVLAMLAAADVDTAGLDPAALAAAVYRSRTRRSALALADLRGSSEPMPTLPAIPYTGMAHPRYCAAAWSPMFSCTQQSPSPFI
jgi:hypothetical protein